MSTKALTILLLFVIAPVMLWCLCLAKITVNVVDESGNAVQNATVSVVFKYGHLRKDAVVDRTDDEGRCSFIARTPDGTLVGEVTKDNFYQSTINYAFISRQVGLWLPWNKEIDVVMRPIKHPVPMYVRNRDFDIPAIGKKIGLDLMIGDWVAPHGKGVNGDFIFEHRRKYKDNYNFDSLLELTFSNRHDGIQIVNEDTQDPFTTRSSYLLPRFAPANGYQAAFVKHISKGVYGNSRWSDDMSYIFRIRSESDPKGKFQRAMHGKIRGDITFFPTDGANGKIRLHYFLNPDYSRNLEFNPKHNLSRGVSEYERVEAP